MENQPHDTKIVLKVNLSCCEACPKKLEKALFKHTGVSSHTINTEENLVSLSGTVEPATIIKLIYAKLARKAKLVSYKPQSTDDKEEKPRNTKNVEDKDSILEKIIELIYAKLAKKAKLVSYEPQSTDDKEEKPRNTKNVEDKDSINKIKSPHKEEMHKTCGCQDGSCPMMGNNVHKYEVYDPPHEVKDYVCRNYFCKPQPRSREITDKVPEHESSARLHGGYMPNVYYGVPNPGYQHRRWNYPMWCPKLAQEGYYPSPMRP